MATPRTVGRRILLAGGLSIAIAAAPAAAFVMSSSAPAVPRWRARPVRSRTSTSASACRRWLRTPPVATTRLLPAPESRPRRPVTPEVFPRCKAYLVPAPTPDSASDCRRTRPPQSSRTRAFRPAPRNGRAMMPLYSTRVAKLLAASAFAIAAAVTPAAGFLYSAPVAHAEGGVPDPGPVTVPAPDVQQPGNSGGCQSGESLNPDNGNCEPTMSPVPAGNGDAAVIATDVHHRRHHEDDRQRRAGRPGAEHQRRLVLGVLGVHGVFRRAGTSRCSAEVDDLLEPVTAGRSSPTVESCLLNQIPRISTTWSHWPTAQPGKPGASSPPTPPTPTSAGCSFRCSVLDRQSKRPRWCPEAGNPPAPETLTSWWSPTACRSTWNGCPMAPSRGNAARAAWSPRWNHCCADNAAPGSAGRASSTAPRIRSSKTSCSCTRCG